MRRLGRKWLPRGRGGGDAEWTEGTKWPPLAWIWGAICWAWRAGLPVLEKMDPKLPLADLGWATGHFLDSWVPGSHLRSLDTASDLALAAHGDTAAGLGAATGPTARFATAGAGAGWHTAADGHTAAGAAAPTAGAAAPTAGAAAPGAARAAHGSGGLRVE